MLDFGLNSTISFFIIPFLATIPGNWGMFGREKGGMFECVLPEESRYFGGFFEERIENFYSKNPPMPGLIFGGMEG